LIFAALACTKKSQENPKNIKLKVGETYEYFYQNNSCCTSIFNRNELKTIHFKEHKTYYCSEEDGGGCDLSLVFEAKKIGKDTLKFGIVDMGSYLDADFKDSISYYRDSVFIDVAD